MPNVFIPLALMLHDLKYKLAIQKGPSNCKLVIAFFGLFVVSSSIWGYLYMQSKDEPSSLDASIWTSGVVIAMFIVLFTFLGMKLNDGHKLHLIVLLDVMTLITAITCFLDTSQFWLVGSLQAIQVLLFFVVIKTFYLIDTRGFTSISKKAHPKKK